VRHPPGNHPRFARSRPGNDQQRPVHVGGGFALGFGEVGEQFVGRHEPGKSNGWAGEIKHEGTKSTKRPFDGHKTRPIGHFLQWNLCVIL
jgi:hypothetical protein